MSQKEPESKTTESTNRKTLFSYLKKGIYRIETARKITQFCCFLLLNAVVFGLGPWPLVLPIIGTLGTPTKTVLEAFGTVQWMLFELVIPFLALASILLTAVFVSRSLCGWVCPFGFVQDLLKYVKKRHTQVSPRTHDSMIKIKYFILAVLLFISGTLAITLAAGVGRRYKTALGEDFARAPFNALSPADTLFAVLPRIVLEARYGIPTLIETGTVADGILSAPLFLWIRLAIMIGIIGLAAYIPRSWCRYFCPNGALMGLLSHFSFLGLKRDPVKCTKVGCRLCVEACPMMVRILDMPWEKFNDPDCIYCLKCTDACPTKAILPKFS
ncbi:MAG: 4Fe-4S binding protein [Candidatus Bathyarchaeota archaeon]|nr:MAG: 4Fe-4S binding protein [Candidatus Bathyarchaeota archaeon]